MIYFFLGDDKKHDTQILELKQKYLTTPLALQFDCDVLTATKLDKDSLKKTLLLVPAVSKQRLIVIRDCHQMNEDNKTFLVDFVSHRPDEVVLILESRELTSQDSFVKRLKSFAKISESFIEEKTNVFSMTRALSERRLSEALKILSELLMEGVHPLQIMGGVVWFWGKTRSQLSFYQFENGLKVLEEADLNMKRSRLKPDYTLEVLITKLAEILRAPQKG